MHRLGIRRCSRRVSRAHTSQVPVTHLASSWRPSFFRDPSSTSTKTLASYYHNDCPETSDTISKSNKPCKPRSQVQYTPLEDIEPIERYQPGGFHPIAIGDTLHNSRYRIVHKLGFGGYATIWLARDQLHGQYVAIKIAAADALDDSKENAIFNHLQATGTANVHPGKIFIPQLLDEFIHTGPNGRHRCLVTIPGSMSLIEAKDASYYRLFQPQTARVIIAQLVQAIAFLHSRDVVHGDIHLGNILLRLPKSINNLPPEELYQQYGLPDLERISRIDGQPLPPGVPTHGVVSIWLGKDSEDVTSTEASITLSDFGESFLPFTTQKTVSRAPPLLVPPEARFSLETLSLPADIWALACAIWEILGQRPLFESFFPTEDSVTAEQVEVLGKLPSRWWARWENRLEWFNEEGGLEEVAEGLPRERRSWEERFEYSIQKPRKEKKLAVVEEEERVALFSLLRSMLAFKPEERATIRDVFDSKWMKVWALPGLDKMKS